MHLEKVIHFYKFYSSLKSIFLVFPYDFYANITMGLNRTKTIPNSTDVWWEMSELENKYTYIPSCKKQRESVSCLIH